MDAGGWYPVGMSNGENARGGIGLPSEPLPPPGGWRYGLALAAVALMPLSFNIGYYVLATRKPLYLSPLDLLAPVLLLVLAWDALKGRVRGWAPPLPNAALAGWALLSLAWVGSGGLTDWARGAVLQTALIGLVAVWVFRHAARDAAAFRRLAVVWGASLGVCFLYALYQYIQPAGRPLAPGETDLALAGGVTDVRVGGFYAYRGQLAAQAAMLVPACAACAVLDADPALRACAAALGALGLCVTLSGGGFLAACAGVAAVAAALALAGRGREALLVMACTVFVAATVVPRLPRDNPKALWEALSLYASQGPGKAQRPTARLCRTQAAWNLLRDREHWKKGVGAGQYQKTINPYYTEPYPKPGRNTDDEAAWGLDADEPMTFGLWETLAVELGLPGLLLAAWLFLAWTGAAWLGFAKAEAAGPAGMLALASLGAAVGAVVFAVFGSPWVRGAGGSFAFLMGLALALHARPQEVRQNER